MDEFPPETSKSKKVKPEEKPEATKIIEGAVIRRKKPLGARFKEVFAGNFKSAGSYILETLILPGIRGIIVDSVSKGTERIVMGETQRQMRRSSSGMGSRTMYNSSPLRRDPRDGGYEPQRALPAGDRPRLDDIILTQREDAEVIVEMLLGAIEKYEFVTVADLMHSLGYASSYVDQGWGWSNLSSISMKQVREGYLIELPDPEPR